MKIFRSIMFLFFCFAFIPNCIAQTNRKAIKNATTTTVQFENGNQYGKFSTGNWLKLNNGGFEVIKAKQEKQERFEKSNNEGKWVLSDSNLTYQFADSRFPKKMANYKDLSIIVAGLETPSSIDSHRVFINRSTDQGQSWQRIYQELTDSAQFNFYQVQHPSLSRIIAISTKFVKDSLGVDRRAYILMNSNDTAASWTVNDSIFGIYDTPVAFDFKGKYGVISVVTPDSSNLLYSENYGDSWTTYPLPTDLKFGVGNVLKKGSILLAETYPSSKMGYINDIKSGTWQYKNLPNAFNSFHTYIRNKDTIWSATSATESTGSNFQRNIIIGSTNGGQSWQKPLDTFENNILQRFGLNNIEFATKNYGVALGNNVSYFTKDGGKSWKNMGLYYRPLTVTPQTTFYYYNPVTEKRLLMTLMNNNYIMKYKFKASTSLNELKHIEIKLNVYPNPANDILFLELPSNLDLKNMKIRVLSIDGKFIRSLTPHNLTNNRFKMSIGNLPSGTYIIQLSSKTYKGNKKLIVE